MKKNIPEFMQIPLLTTAAGIILWKEMLSKRQWFGLVMGGVAIFLLCNIL